MKHAFVVLLLSAGLLLSTAAQSLPLDSGLDLQVLVCVLAHLRTQPRFDYPAKTRLKDVVLLTGQYEESTGLISASQFQTDLTGEGWNVPEALRLDLVRRTVAKIAFPAGKFPVWVRLVPPNKNVGKALASASAKRPGAKYHVTFWPPGYSADGKQAVVRFLFSPGSPHGADAIYYLEFRRGRWQVVHRVVLERV